MEVEKKDKTDSALAENQEKELTNCKSLDEVQKFLKKEVQKLLKKELAALFQCLTICKFFALIFC
jgi:type IV secretory pathway component VirB8